MSSLSDAEIRLAGFGLNVFEDAEVFEGRREELDSLLVMPAAMTSEGGPAWALFVRPGTPADRRAALAEWAEGVIHRTAEHGFEQEGWDRRPTQGGWQMWCRLHVVSEELFDLASDAPL